MSWWHLTIAVWFAVSFGSIAVVYAAAEVRQRRERRRRAADAATFEALVATIESEPRTLA